MELGDLIEEKQEVKAGSVIKRLIPIFNTDIPKEIRSESYKNYSAGLTPGGSISRGLDHDEEKKYLPSLIGVSTQSPNWESSVREFWENFSSRVEYAGKELECGVDESGIPLNVDDYCLARLAEKDPDVMVTANVKDASMSHGYILVDVDALKKVEKENNNTRKDADRKYIELIDSDKAETTMRFILVANAKFLELPITVTMLYDLEALEVACRNFKDKNPDRFVKSLSNKNVEFQAAVLIGAEFGLITYLPHTEKYYYKDEPLGDLKQAALYMKTNTSAYSELLSDIEAAKKLNA